MKMKLVSVQEMRAIERASDAAGLDYAEMMERAGRAVAAAINERTAPQKVSVLVLVGPGNNGGDGLVAAWRLAVEGHAVTVYLWKRSGETDKALLDRAIAAGATLQSYAEDAGLDALAGALQGCDVVVDALLGTGASGRLRDGAGEILASVSEMIAQRSQTVRPTLQPIGNSAVGCASARRPLIVAVDVPSGLNADTGEIDERALAVDLCITFAYPKQGHFSFPGAARVGELFVADIGTAPELAASVGTAVVVREDVAGLLPARPLDSHKGTYGKVLVVAGSINYVGAPALAARAAYRIGAGLVTLAVPAPIQPALASQLPEATYLPLPNDMGVIAPQALPLLAERLQTYSVLLLGPGITQEEPTREFVRALMERHANGARTTIGFITPLEDRRSTYTLPPTVIDADGLNLLARIPSWWELLPDRTVLTPHPAEMARLLGTDSLASEGDRIVVATRGGAQVELHRCSQGGVHGGGLCWPRHRRDSLCGAGAGNGRHR